MPAPATSSRHLYTGHRRGHIQPAPRLRAHRSEPLSQDHPQIPVSMPSLSRFDASAIVHTCSSSHRTPAPLTARRQPQRSPPRLLTDAACGGLQSPPARRPRRTCLHHWHSTDRADDLLHHHHFPSGHTRVPETRPWSLTCRDAVRCGVLVYRISYRFLVPGWSAKPLVSAHDRIMGTHTARMAPGVHRPGPRSAPLGPTPRAAHRRAARRARHNPARRSRHRPDRGSDPAVRGRRPPTGSTASPSSPAGAAPELSPCHQARAQATPSSTGSTSGACA